MKSMLLCYILGIVSTLALVIIVLIAVALMGGK